MLTLHLASWNIDTLNPTEKKKRKNLLEQLNEHTIDIACLQETKKLGKDSFDLENYKVLYCGRNTSPAKYGVGFAIKKSCFETIKFREGTKPTERIYYLVLKQASVTIHLINVYAPQIGRDASEKEEFYANLEKVFTLIPDSDVVFLIGDLNAKVGRDPSKWPNIIGEHGFGETDNNGNRLLEFCGRYDLVITNTCFQVEEGTRPTRANPGRTILSQLDLCVTRQQDITIVKSTKTCKDLLNGFTHRMVVVKVEIDSTIKRMGISRKERLLFVSVKLISTIKGNDLTSDISRLWKSFEKTFSKDSALEEMYTNLQEIFKTIQCSEEQRKGADFAKMTLDKKEEIKREWKEKLSKLSSSFFPTDAGLADISSSDEVNRYTSILNVDFTNEKEYVEPQKKTSYRFVEISKKELKGAIDSVLYSNFTNNTNSQSLHDSLKAMYDSDEFNEFFGVCWKLGIIPNYILLADAICLNETPVSNTIGALSIVREIFQHCIYRQLKELMKLEEPIHGCLMTFSEKEMLFSLNLIQDMFLAIDQPLYIGLIDLFNASLFTDTDFIIEYLEKMSIPLNLCKMLKLLSVKSKIITKLDETKQESIVDKIVMQLFWSCVLTDSFLSGDGSAGIEVVTRQHSDPFDSLDSTSLPETLIIRGFVYGGTMVFLADSAEKLTTNLQCLEKHFKIIGLDADDSQVSFLAQNIKTTKSRERKFTCFGEEFDLSKEINVLGISFSSDQLFTKSIKSRIDVALKTKTEMQWGLNPTSETIEKYYIQILSPLILNLDILTIDSNQEKDIAQFHVTFLNELQGQISCGKVETNLTTKSIPTILSYKRLIVFGDIYRLRMHSNIRSIFYSNVKTRKSKLQRNSFLNLCKIDLQKFEVKEWQTIVSKKDDWIQKLNEKLLQLE